VNDIRQCGLNYDRQRVHELLPEDPSFKMVGDTGIETIPRPPACQAGTAASKNNKLQMCNPDVTLLLEGDLGRQ
jgi:hypothetical protein